MEFGFELLVGGTALLLHVRFVCTGNLDLCFLRSLLAVPCSVSGCFSELKFQYDLVYKGVDEESVWFFFFKVHVGALRTYLVKILTFWLRLTEFATRRKFTGADSLHVHVAVVRHCMLVWRGFLGSGAWLAHS